MIACGAPIAFKAGGSFVRAGAGYLPQGVWTAASQVRSRYVVPPRVDDLIATFTVSLVSTGGPPVPRTDGLGMKYPWFLTLSCDPASTLDWPPGLLDCDVKFTDSTGLVRFSQTFQIACSVEVTRV